MKRRTVLVDLVFVLDATESTQGVFTDIIDQVNDISIDLHIAFRKAILHYGAVIYHDPVSYHPLPEATVAADDDFKDSDENEAKYDLEKYPENKNVAIDLVDQIETLMTELEKVKTASGHNDPEDWAGALSLALNNISWREGSKRCIVWISDSNAHGKIFCGYDNYNEEEEKLERLVQQLAESITFFAGINILKGTDNGCERTLSVMKEMYTSFGGSNFINLDFRPTYYHMKNDDDNWPGDFSCLDFAIGYHMEPPSKLLSRSITNALRD